MRRLSLLQWVGLLVAPAAWFAQHAVGQAVAQASCSRANLAWGISNTDWQIGLLVGAGTLILVSEAAAVAAYRGSRPASYESPPPFGRIQLFAIAAMCTNLIYLVIVLLDGVASIAHGGCTQS
jgi:hypothetical protein